MGQQWPLLGRRVGEWESGRVGEWRVGEWRMESGMTCPEIGLQNL
ncbi:MAG TPA: hypothetical protein VJ951_07040 [Bacteroidales bacterium]|nr:hypothetical protein [Bacteroidales bacterium]